MSLQVKFPYGRGHGPLHTCSDCSFATRHRVLFERHMKRCPAKQAMEVAKGKLPAPPVCRNYRCEKCNYTSNKARVFLFHKKRVHGENITVYVCNKCEYASKHKNKVFRHRRLVHKDPLPIDNIGTLEDDSDLVGDDTDNPQVDSGNSYSVGNEDHYDYSTNGGVEEGVDMDQACYGEDDQFNIVDEDDAEVSFKVPENEAGENDDPENAENNPNADIIDANEKAMDYIVWNERGVGKTPIGSCQICGYTNALRWKIAHHIRTTHMKKNMFQCPHCDFVCQRKIEWCVHKTSHTKHKVHSCNECSYKTTMKRNMERHTARHKQNGPYKCSFCSYSSTGEAVIQRHMAEYHADSVGQNSTPVPARVIEQPEKLTVKRVQRARKTGPTVSSSALVFSSKHPYAAPSVTTATPTKNSPAPTTGSGSPEVTCDLCGLVVKTESRLRIHMVSHSTLAAWTCPLCPLRYKRPADLNRHMKRKHGVKLSDYKRGSAPEQDQPLDLCVKKEDQSMEEESTEDESRENTPLDLSVQQNDNADVAIFKQDVVKCSFCSYKSNVASDLRRHMLVHSVEKRFRCQYCGQRYKFQSDLTLHLSSYHRVSTNHARIADGSVGSLIPTTEYSSDEIKTELPDVEEEDMDTEENKDGSQTTKKEDLQCRFCPYVGKYKTETERHMRLHTGEKPYQCMYCLYRTIWKGDMKRHLPKHHADEVLKHGNLQDLVDKTWNPWPDSLRRTSDPDSMQDKYGDRDLADFPDPMASLAALVDGGLEDSQVEDVPPEENNNESPQKGRLESCYLGGSWEVSNNDSVIENKEEKPEAGGTGGKNREECSICGHVTYPAAMKQHMEKHSNLRRFMCPDCGKRSNWPWDIKKHIKEIHHGDIKSLVELTEQEARDTLDEYLATNLHRTYRSSSIPRETPERETGGSGLANKEASPASEFSKKRSPSPEKVVTPVKKGRFRKFKCSKCGKRSNWRWDLNKHIRSSHPGAKIIELSEEEAQATFHEVLQRQKSPSPMRKMKEPSPAPKGVSDHIVEVQVKPRLFKCGNCGHRAVKEADLQGHMMEGTACKGAEIIKLSAEEAAELDKDVQQSGKESGSQGDKVNELGVGESVDLLKLKRFKCSHCPYRSNFKSSVMSHKKNKHPGARARIVVLTMNYAKSENFTQVKKKGLVTEGDVEDFQQDASGIEDSPSKDGVRCSPWKCSECDFKDLAKTMVLEHLRKDHPDVPVFTCKICGYNTGYRNSCYRHIRGKHAKVNVMPFVQEPKIMRSTPDRMPEGSPKHNVVNVDEDHISRSSEKVKTFHCSICGIDSTLRSAIVDHIKEAHPKETNTDALIDELETVAPSSQAMDSYEIVPQKRHRSPGVIKRGIIQCNICPYSTSKQGLLKIHKKNHRQHPDKPFKCKYCPYYLSASRLMKQHHRLHWEEMGMKEKVFTSVRTPLRMTLKKKSPLASDVPLDMSPQKGEGGVRIKKTRYLCDKCPLVGYHIKRFMYHKQLHRPKPNHLKCPKCPYWTVSRHCLARHERCHTEAYIKLHRPDLITTPIKKMANMTPGISNLPTVEASPCKSEISDMTTDDVVEMASIKQQVIASKIASVPITPSKLNQKSSNGLPSSAFMPGVVLGSQGQIVSSGPFRKVHKCPHCPYTNVRLASLQMHEKMHQERESSGNGKEIFKCMYCTYQVGNKGLLSLHVRVHSQQYKPGLEEINDVEASEEDGGAKEKETEGEQGGESSENKNDDANDEDEVKPKPPKIAKFPEKHTYPRDLSTHYDMNKLPLKTEYYVKFNDRTGEHILERAVYKKWCCEKCPYATMKKSQFEKHALLHGSAQKYTCEFCDYSVPGYHLLLQHKRLHLAPNPNLLSVQSIANLQRLPTIPADVAAAGNFCEEIGPRDDSAGGSCDRRPLTHHESIDLYENSAEFSEPKKLYRCDRCPYTNTRRDHLLSHLKFHMMKSDVKCPFCDYSVSKVHLLNQHIKVHFNTPGSEMNAEGPSSVSGETEADSDWVPKVVMPSGSSQPPELVKVSETGPSSSLSKNSEEKQDDNKDGKTDSKGEAPNKSTESRPPESPSARVTEKMEVEESNDGQTQGLPDISNDTSAQPAQAIDLSMKSSSREEEAPTLRAVGSCEECRYCNREFIDLAKLQRHEAQHVMGTPYART